MKARIPTLLSPARIYWCVLAAIIMLLCGGTLASAQGWRTVDAENAWTAYNDYFYNGTAPPTSGKGYYYHEQGGAGGGSEEMFWTFAEEIEMAEDVTYWEETNNPGQVATDKVRIANLINGFRNLHGDDWSSDVYNDDLSVAVLAFVRCWELTSSGVCLTDAENNFNTVYSRGYDTDLGGGLWWNNDMPSKPNNTCSKAPTDCIKGSSANWTFVIAGYLLYQASGDSSYKTKADTIYSWAISHLYDSSTGLVYNDEDYQGNMNSGLVTYNFGLAIGAAAEENNSTATNNMANYLMDNSFSGASGATINGYNILPNYGQSTNGFGVFNGMTFRWVSIANRKSGYIPSSYTAWAQTNLDQGWAVRNPYALSWDDWVPDPPASTSPTTPSSGLLSPDCTPILVGFMYLPPTAQ